MLPQGRPEVAQSLIDVRNLKPDDDYSSYYYGSSLRDQSIILYTLTTIGQTTEALEAGQGTEALKC